MTLAWTISIYFVLWWLILFIILPIGIRSHDEAGVAHAPGADRGAPHAPRMIRKFITTTWVTAIFVAGLWLAVHFKIAHLPGAPVG